MSNSNVVPFPLSRLRERAGVRAVRVSRLTLTPTLSRKREREEE
jgi:hypothetical protein